MSNLDRRQLVTGLTVLAGSAGLTAACGRRLQLKPSEHITTSGTKNDWVLGFKNPIAHKLDTPSLKLVSGRMPKGLKGVFFRNGPAIHERAGFRLQHWFDGDGMVQAFNLSAAGVSHKGRMVQTEKYQRDEAEGRFTSNGFGTTIKGALSPTSPHSSNAANTSVLKIGDELMALWEGGAATRLDPISLETLGFKTWDPKLTGMPFSAHPKVEPSGTIWNFGQDAASQRLIIYKIAKSGGLRNIALVNDVPGGMIHDFCMTERSLIFVVPSLRMTKKSDNYLGRFSWMPSESQRVIVLDKDDLTQRRDLELPPGLQYHFGNAYEEKSGDIRFAMCTTDPDFVLTGLKNVMRGKLPKPANGKLTHVILRKNGTAAITSQIDTMGDHEFPQLNPDYSGKFARYLYTIGKTQAGRPLQSAILRHDIQTGDIESFDYGKTAFAEEHVFIPRFSRRNEADGWLVGTVLDFASKTTRLNILDADGISDGPVAVYELPYALPLGFHGSWVGA